MKLRQSRNRHIAGEGKMASHGFVCRIARLSLIMLPHDGVGGVDRETEEGQRALEGDDGRDADQQERHADGRDVGQQLLHEDAPVGRALDLGRDDVVLGGDSSWWRCE